MILKWMVAIIVLGLGVLSVSAFAEQAGSRTDQTPWFGYGSITDRILKLEGKIQDTQLQMSRALRNGYSNYRSQLKVLENKEKNAGYFGWPFITDSKSDYREKIDELNESYQSRRRRVNVQNSKRLAVLNNELQDSLASPPNDKIRQKIKTIKLGTETHEAMEVYDAAKNLVKSINQLNDKLAAKPSDYSLAVKTYSAQDQLIRDVIEMNQAFVNHVQQKYIPRLNSLAYRIVKAKRKVSSAASMSRQMKVEELSKLSRLGKAIMAARPKLKQNMTWAKGNIQKLRGTAETLSVLRNDASIAKDASSVVAKINVEAAHLKIVMPGIIRWELKGSDLKIKDIESPEHASSSSNQSGGNS